MKNKQILLFILLFSAFSLQASWFSSFWDKDSVITKAVCYFTAPKLENGINGFADDYAQEIAKAKTKKVRFDRTNNPMTGENEVESLVVPLSEKQDKIARRRTTARSVLMEAWATVETGSKIIDGLQAENSGLKDERTRLTNEIKEHEISAAAVVATTIQAIDKAAAELTALNAQNDNLRAENIVKDAKLQEVQKRIKAQAEQMRAAQQRVTEINGKISTLEEENKGLRAENNAWYELSKKPQICIDNSALELTKVSDMSCLTQDTSNIAAIRARTGSHDTTSSFESHDSNIISDSLNISAVSHESNDSSIFFDK